MKKQFLVATLLCLMGTSQAAPSTNPFSLLQAGDTPLMDCGSFIHDKDVDPTTNQMRAFMSTDKNLYLRVNNKVRSLELVRVDQKMRDKDILGRGDTISLEFSNATGESATLAGTVVEAVVDDSGEYPLIQISGSLKFKTGKSKKPVSAEVVVHDMCR